MRFNINVFFPSHFVEQISLKKVYLCQEIWKLPCGFICSASILASSDNLS